MLVELLLQGGPLQRPFALLFLKPCRDLALPRGPARALLFEPLGSAHLRGPTLDEAGFRQPRRFLGFLARGLERSLARPTYLVVLPPLLPQRRVPGFQACHLLPRAAQFFRGLARLGFEAHGTLLGAPDAQVGLREDRAHELGDGIRPLVPARGLVLLVRERAPGRLLPALELFPFGLEAGERLAHPLDGVFALELGAVGGRWGRRRAL